MKVQKEVAGQMVTIEVDMTSGVFSYISSDGQYRQDASLPKLVDKVRQLLAKRKVRVDIPVGIIDGHPVNVRLVAMSTKAHNDVLIKGQDGKAGEPISGNLVVYQPWTEETAAEYERLRLAYTAAQDAIERFKTAHLFVGTDTYKSRAGGVTEKAVNAKAEELEAKERAAAQETAPIDPLVAAIRAQR